MSNFLFLKAIGNHTTNVIRDKLISTNIQVYRKIGGEFVCYDFRIALNSDLQNSKDYTENQNCS